MLCLPRRNACHFAMKRFVFLFLVDYMLMWMAAHETSILNTHHRSYSNFQRRRSCFTTGGQPSCNWRSSSILCATNVACGTVKLVVWWTLPLSLFTALTHLSESIKAAIKHVTRSGLKLYLLLSNVRRLGLKVELKTLINCQSCRSRCCGKNAQKIPPQNIQDFSMSRRQTWLP